MGIKITAKKAWQGICPEKTAAETGGDCETARKACTADGNAGTDGAQTEIREKGSIWQGLPDASFLCLEHYGVSLYNKAITDRAKLPCQTARRKPEPG